MDAVLEGMLRNGLTVSNRQTENYTSDQVVYVAAAGLRPIKIATPMGGPAAFLRILCTQAAEVWFKKPGKNEVRYFEGLVANVGLNVVDENVEEFRIVPAAYPATLNYYASAYNPPANPTVPREKRMQ